MNSFKLNYIDLFLNPIKICKRYKPKMGGGNSGKGYSLDEFLSLYQQDSFYSWIGLDSAMMYAAHKAAGGMTSIYRQIGVGCENIFRQVIIDFAEYEDVSLATWKYETMTKSGNNKILKLDGRLEVNKIKNPEKLGKLKNWITEYCESISAKVPTSGIVFEVRQGYKSKDSKRQNADIDNVSVAWANGYLPVFAIFSNQIDIDLILRYRNNRAGILTGTLANDNKISLFAFSQQILDFDMIDFFKFNSSRIRNEINTVLETLLSAK